MRIDLSKAGVIENWKNTEEWLSWDIKVTKPGKYSIEIISMIQKPFAWIGEEVGRWEGGHNISIEIAGHTVDFLVKEGERLDNSRSIYYKKMRSTDNSIITIDKPGIYTLSVKPKKLEFKDFGFKLQNINLIY